MSSDGLQARQDFLEAQNEYGTSITLRKLGTDEVRDPITYDIITPATPATDIPLKAFIKNVATDKILSKLTDNEKQSYSLYMKFYTNEPLNKEDYIIIFGGNEYVISMIEYSILQGIIWRYEVLIKK